VTFLYLINDPITFAHGVSQLELLRIFTLFSLLLLLKGCTPLANDFDNIVLECGSDANDPTARYIKVLDQHGDSLSTEAITRLIATSNSTNESIFVTSLGCLVVKSDAKLISANAQSLSQSFSKHIDTAVVFQKIKLSPYPEIQTNTNCPEGEIFANSEIRNIWNIVSDSNSETFAFSIFAINEATDAKAILFEKKIGEVHKPIPNELSTKNLPEGVYRLEAELIENTTGWNVAPRLLNGGKQCKMTVIHQNLSEAKIEYEFKSFKPNSSIEVGIDPEKYTTFFCYQNREKIESSNSCLQNISDCENSEVFSRGKIISPVEPGVYDLFTFSRDKAGNDGKKSCLTIAVSKISPAINLKWEKDNLNQSISFFDLPYAVLNAKINVSHSDIPKRELLKNLECKMEIHTQGLFPVKGDLLDCVSGRCAGKNLSEFEPCDEDFSVSLTRAWEMPGFNRSVLELHVRTNDGAGNESTKKLSVMVNDSRWTTEPLPMPPGDDGQMIRLLPDGTYLTYGTKSKKIYRVNRENFEDTHLEMRNVDSVSFYTDTERQVWVAWDEKDENLKISLHLARYKDGLWESVGTHENLKFNAIMSDGFNGFFVSSERAQGEYEVFHYRNNSIKEIKIEINCYMRPNTLVYREKNDTYYESCLNKINYRKSEGKWYVFQGLKLLDGEIANEIVLDSRRNLLASVGNGDRNREKMIYYDFRTAQARKIDFKESSSRIPSDWYFFKDGLGNLFRGVNIWNSKDEIWEKGNDKLQIYPRIAASKAKTTFTTHTFWDEHGTFVRTERDTIYLSAIGTKMTNDNGYQVNTERSEYFFTASTEKLNNVYFRLKRKKLINMGSGYLALPRIIDFFNDEISGRQTIVANRIIYELVDNNWEELGSYFDFFQRRDKSIVYLVNDNSIINQTKIRPFDTTIKVAATGNYFEDSQGDVWSSSGHGTFGLIRGSVASIYKNSSFSYMFAANDKIYAMNDRNEILSFSKENFEKPTSIDNSKFGINRIPQNCRLRKDTISVNLLFFMCSRAKLDTDNVSFTDFYTLETRPDGEDSLLTHFEMPESKELTANSIIDLVKIDDNGRMYITGNSGIYRWEKDRWTLMISLADVFGNTKDPFMITNYTVQKNGDIWLMTGRIMDGPLLYRPAN
jgi:hypothetical protein